MHSIFYIINRYSLEISSDSVCAYKDMQLIWLSLMLIVMNLIYPITNSFQGFVYLSKSPEASDASFY